MASSYIILRSSVEQAAYQANPAVFQGKKFIVQFQNYAPAFRKSGEERETIGGWIDIESGPIFYTWRGVVRCHAVPSSSETAQGFGSLSDLETYFLLNDPGGTPSNLLTLVDNLGVGHTGYLRGKEFSAAPMTPYIDGSYATFFVPLTFLERSAVL